MAARTILFVCKGNSGRSQMAEAFFNSLSKNGRAISAGTAPDKEIHPWTIKVMKDAGIDVTRQKPKLLTDKLIKKADRIIVMDKALLKEIKLPAEYSVKLEVWDIAQLLGRAIDEVAIIRDDIRNNVTKLIRENYS